MVKAPKTIVTIFDDRMRVFKTLSLFQVVLVLALAAVVAARPQFQQQQVQQQVQPVKIIPVLSRNEVRDDYNQLSLSYLSGDGTAVSEHGALKQVTEGEHRGDYFLAKQGSWRYTSPEGRIIMVTYTADENGFHPISEAIPVDVVPVN